MVVRVQLPLLLLALCAAGCGSGSGATSRSSNGQPYVRATATSTGPTCEAASGVPTDIRYGTSPPAKPRAGQLTESGPLTTWSRAMDDPALAFPARGETVVAANEGVNSPAAVLVTIDHHGNTVVSHSTDHIVGGPEALPAGQIALLTATVCNTGMGVPVGPFIYRLVLRTGAPTSVLGRRGALLSTRTLAADMAADAHGDVAVLWGEYVGGRSANFLVVRSASGRLGRTEALPYIGEPQDYVSSDDYAVALGPRGDLLLTNTVAASPGPGREVIARYQPVGGRLGAPMLIGRSRRQVEVVAALDDRGGAVIAWGSKSYGPDYPNPWLVRAVVRPRAGAAFGRTQVLDSGAANHGPADDDQTVADGPSIYGPGVSGSVQVMMIGRQPIVEWTAREAGDRTPTRVALADAAGRFSPPTKLADRGELASPPLGENGAALFVYTDGSALVVRPGASATATDATLPGDQVTNVGAAVDPYTGLPVIAWTQHVGHDGQAPDQLRIADLGLPSP
jgi:hypothetical protein